jgi:hypothetical protein
MILTKKESSFLDKVVKGKWSINPNTDLVDVDGIVDMSHMKLIEIPVKFGNVSGYFYCPFNQFTSLKGAPQSVGGDFSCNDNELTSLAGAPQSVGGYFNISYNQLTSLVGAPQSIGGGFYCSYNQLTSLVGAPQSVGGGFNCSNNQLTSLAGAPQSVSGDFICSNKQLTSLEGAPEVIGGTFDINLGEIYEEYYHVIIPEIEELISKGIKIYNPGEYYYPYKEAYYNDKIIELL